MEPDSSEQVNHILQKANPRETCHRQPSLQWRDEGRDERQVVHWFLLKFARIIENFEVLQVLKYSNEIYDLAAGPPGISQGERSDCRLEVTKIPSDPRDELGDLQVIYPKFLDVG